ncbi:unnamed protein product [Caenorhabditis nigoni]
MKKCKICGLPGSGNHFGISSCRACAAFFRRTTSRKYPLKCSGNEKCEIFDTKIQQYKCKKCRMEKCLKMGMKTENFQFGRDPIIRHAAKNKPEFLKFEKKPSGKNYIDLTKLLNKAEQILSSDKPKIIKNLTTLLNLAHGLESVRNLPSSKNYRFLRKWDVEDKLKEWETSFLIVAKWLTYFEKFQMLDVPLKMEFLIGIWHTWVLFDKLFLNFHARKNGFGSGNVIMGYDTYYSWNNTIDMSGFSKIDEENADEFIRCIDWNMLNFIDPLMRLNPDNVEMMFMICKFSFSYAGKRFQGQILEISENFLDILSNDLHDYYSNRNVRYSIRLAELLKFVRSVENDFLEKQKKVDIGDIFDIWKVEFSHPQVFKDNLC